MSDRKKYEYYAFISYSRKDEKWAKWLQRKLEGYRFPSAIRKKNATLPKKIFPVFLDKTDLSGTDLEEALHHQLEESEFLIVVCSPNSAVSKYVDEETRYFSSLGRRDRIIPFIVAGSPNADDEAEMCYCPALKDPKMGNLLGVNINELGKRKALLRLISDMTKLRFDLLVNRDNARRRKRLISFAAAAAALILTVTVAFQLIMGPERSAALAQESATALNHGSILEAVETGKKSVKNLLFAKEGDDGVVALRSALVAQALNETNYYPHEEFRVETHSGDGSCFWVGNSADNKQFYLYDWGQVYVYDNETGELLEEYPMDEYSEEAAAFAQQFGWAYDEDHSFSNNTGRKFWEEKRRREQTYKLTFDNNALTVSNGTDEHTYQGVQEEDFCYCFNADETVFAYYSNNYLHVEDFSTGFKRTWRYQFENSCDLALSPLGRYLIAKDSKEFQVFDSLAASTPKSYVFSKLFSVEEDDYAWYEVTLTDTFDDFFYVSGPYGFIKYAYCDGKISKDVSQKTVGHTLYNYYGSVRISPDKQVCFSTGSGEIGGFLEYKQYIFFKNDPKDPQSLLTLTFYDSVGVSYDENMTIAATTRGKIYSIRDYKTLYNNEAGFDEIEVSKDGKKAAAMASDGTVSLFDINGDQVTERFIFDFDDIKKAEDDPGVWSFSIGEEYITITTEHYLYYYNLTDGSLTTKEGYDFQGLVNWEEPSCSYEKDGLFFLSCVDGGRCIIDPKTQTYLEEVVEADDDLQDADELWPFYYTEKTHLLCGTKYIGQQSSNNAYTVYENVNHRFVKLHSFRCSSEAEISFSSDGRYLIINTPQGTNWTTENSKWNTTVLDARTGTVMLDLPGHRITIVDDTIYDVNAAYTPVSLPYAHLYSVEELKKAAK